MDELGSGARVAIIGAGPGGLSAAKHAIEAGFDVSVFEASDDLGGQWNTTAAHSGIWPGMRTNTSRAMTAFSDYPAPPTHELHPVGRADPRLSALATPTAFGVTDRIRFRHPGQRRCGRGGGWTASRSTRSSSRPGGSARRCCRPGWTASPARCCTPSTIPGADHFRDRRVLVYGNGVSGHEIASDIATVTQVISAYRKPRYVLQKNVAGVSSDWQWYTHIGALRRAAMAPRRLRRTCCATRVLRVAGNPADFGAPEPDDGLPARRPFAVPGLPRAGTGRSDPLPARDRRSRAAIR